MSSDKKKPSEPLNDRQQDAPPPPYEAGPSSTRPRQPNDKSEPVAPPSYAAPPWRLISFFPLPDRTLNTTGHNPSPGEVNPAEDVTPAFKRAAARAPSFSPHTITKLGPWDWSHPPWWKSDTRRHYCIPLIDRDGWTFQPSIWSEPKCPIQPPLDSVNSPVNVPEGQWTWAGRSGIGIVDGVVWEVRESHDAFYRPIYGRHKHKARCLEDLVSVFLGDLGYRGALRHDGTLLVWNTRSVEYEMAAPNFGSQPAPHAVQVADLTQTGGRGYIFQLPRLQPYIKTEPKSGWIDLHALAHTTQSVPLADQSEAMGPHDEGERVVHFAMGQVLLIVKANGELWVGSFSGRTYDPPNQTMLWSLLGVVKDPQCVGITVTNNWIGLFRNAPDGHSSASLSAEKTHITNDVENSKPTDVHDAYVIYVHHDHKAIQINPVTLSHGSTAPSPIVELAIEPWSHALDDIGLYLASARTLSGQVHFWATDTIMDTEDSSSGSTTYRKQSLKIGHAANPLQLVEKVSTARINIPTGLYPTSVQVGCVMCVRTEEWRREDEPNAEWFGEQRSFLNRLVGRFTVKEKSKEIEK